MGAAAIVGGIGAGIGGISSLVGGISSAKAQKEAAEAQQQYMNRALDLAEDKLALFQEQQQAWESVFGPIQDNLAGYYNNLDPNSFAAKNIQNLEMEYNRANTQVNEELARRGLSGSGAAISATAGLASDLATRRAEARANAVGQVAQQQLGFLQGVGLPQKQMITAGLSGGYDTLIGTTGNMANVYGQQANQAGQMIANSFGNVGKSILQGATLGLMDSALNSNNTLGASSSSLGGNQSTTSNWTNYNPTPTSNVSNINPLTGNVYQSADKFNYLDYLKK